MIRKTNMTQEEAIAFASTEWWKGKTASEIIDIQLFEERLVMPYDLFQESLEAVLHRPVQTVEIAGMALLQYEYLTNCLHATEEDLSSAEASE